VKKAHFRYKNVYTLTIGCFIILLLPVLSSCATNRISQIPGNDLAARAQSGLDQTQVLSAQASGLSKVEVLFAARVKKLLPDDTQGLPHQRFLLELNNGTTVLVAHDIKYAPKVPIQPGDIVTIQGEYVWNKKGGLVHWTHHSDSPRHRGGYIDFNGQRYQ
jgi:translation initiation factor IF-1